MTKSRKLKTPKFPPTIIVVDYSDNYHERGERRTAQRLKVLGKDYEPLPDNPRVQAIYKLAGVEGVSSKLLVTRKTIK